MITLRLATVADLSQINDIYNYFILNSAITFDIEPWDMARRTNWFNQMQQNSRYLILVAQYQGKVIGFAYNSAYNPKAAFNHSTEVTIYKAHDCSIKGVGRCLYKRLLSQLKRLSYHRVYALITIPNLASDKLHQQLGFNQVGLLSQVGEKHGQHHDVALFEKAL